MQIASSTARETTVVSIVPATAEVIDRRPFKCGYRVAVAFTQSGELALTPSWAFGTGDNLTIADRHSLRIVFDASGTEYSTIAAAASQSYVVAVDKYHTWFWQRNQPSTPRDIELPDDGIAFHPVGILSVGNSFRLILRHGAYSLAGRKLKPVLLETFETGVSAICQSKNGKFFVGFEDGRVELRELSDMELLNACPVRASNRVTSITLAHAKPLVAIGFEDGTVTIWNFDD